MWLALDLVEPVAERVEEVLVRRDDRSIKCEFDHRERPTDRSELSVQA